MKQTGLSLAACWTLLFVTIQRSTADVKAPRSVTPRVRSTWDRENTGRKNVLYRQRSRSEQCWASGCPAGSLVVKSQKERSEQTGNRKAWPCQLFILVMCSIGWMQLHGCVCMLRKNICSGTFTAQSDNRLQYASLFCAKLSKCTAALQDVKPISSLQASYMIGHLRGSMWEARALLNTLD